MSGTSNAAGFRCYGGGGSTVTVLAAKSSQRYRLQCDTLPSLCLLTSQLVQRLSRHFSKHEDFTCSYSSSLPLHELFSEIGTHFLFRKKARKIQVSTSDIISHLSSIFIPPYFLHLLPLAALACQSSHTSPSGSSHPHHLLHRLLPIPTKAPHPLLLFLLHRRHLLVVT